MEEIVPCMVKDGLIKKKFEKIGILSFFFTISLNTFS
jgi:hypothetical protein